ncbi:vascular endothelial growth factor receptor 1 isoform X2 [Megalops cyprinoides]|uniref:vascular endothelial growth factor receptor 1 isoform X2 n=1 Tax=Megalops cyprinoides TaxID=118141 RepID=UPI001865332C|nr:vascular endothelial growth factor receptor 1 isoform X2 [Megalops cyprinoides]
MLYFVMFALCGWRSALAKDQTSKGRLSAPVLNVTSRELVMEANQTLQLHCRGQSELSWAFPVGVAKDQRSVRVVDSRCEGRGHLHCSSLTLSGAQPRHTGSFRCRYRHQHSKQTSLYVYVTGSQQPFVEVQTEVPGVVFMKEGEALVFPCRVTAPHIPVALIKFPGQRLVPDQKSIIWSSKKGFIIPSPSYRFSGLFSCETRLNGILHSAQYLTHRPVNKILDVYLNSTRPVRSLRGERLALTCTVTAEWNSRVSITWSYPGQVNDSASISRRIVKGTSSIMFLSVLSITELSRADRGVYVCRVRSGPVLRETNTSVTVYDRPFIRLKHRHGPVVNALAGQKSYRLSPKLRAFPPPEVIWLKDGMVAAERCSRYHVDGHALVIRDVAEEDAGLYTILVGIQEHGLYRNLTLSLVVNVKPQIGEKAVSVRDPGTYPRGSRQALLCTSQGFPPPQIHWLWHPCPQRGPCESPSSSRRRLVRPGPGVTSAENSILSISQQQEVLEGRNKTVGVLMVAEASVSGVYCCVASNHVGKDRRDIRFYVSDVPNGFSVELEGEPREGSEAHLACRANKHLYTGLSWRLATPSLTAPPGLSATPGLPTPPGLPVVQHEVLWTGEFSHTLRLTLSNLTVQDSGTYRCSAHHLLTGEQLHLDAQVTIIALEAPVLLQNLTDCSVNVSSSVTLSCHAQGVPHPQVTWYKDQRKLQQGSGIMLAPGGGTLHIERITAEDEGMYTCEATNEKGSVESSAYVWVDDSAETSSLEIPTLTCTCVVATLFWLLLTLFIRKLKQPRSTGVKTDYLSIILAPGEGPLDEQCDSLPYDPGQWEFPRDRLKLEKPLGRGAFGKVMQASAFGINNSSSCKTVAVKMLKDGATPSEHKALMTELKILIHIGHHLNVVNLLGACTKPGGPLMVIVEYCRYGNLSTYLKTKRDVFLPRREHAGEEKGVEGGCGAQAGSKRRLASVSSRGSTTSSGFEDERENMEEEGDSLSLSGCSLVLEDLISYSFQVARGMEFLASRKCIHRDLAARNILLSENNVVKICDFGLARDVYKDPDYVRKGDARLPLKWMSPESIFDKVFTTQSDVWSFGVLLWEIFSLGASPYPGLHIDEEFCHRLREGTRMRAPEYSTPEIYSTMLSCWKTNPAERPTFTELVGTLGDLLQQRVQQDGKDYIPLNTFLPSDGSTFTELSSLQAAGVRRHSVGSLSQLSSSLRTFEEPMQILPPSADYQTDSGMVLPSEELQCVKWSDRNRTAPSSGFLAARKSRESVPAAGIGPGVYSAPSGHQEKEPPVFTCDCDSQGCCSPPPDYNSALLYPSL